MLIFYILHCLYMAILREKFRLGRLYFEEMLFVLLLFIERGRCPYLSHITLQVV